MPITTPHRRTRSLSAGPSSNATGWAWRCRGIVAMMVVVGLTAVWLSSAFAARASRAVAASASASAISVPATARWTDTTVKVTTGHLLTITARGSWTDGTATSGPNGSALRWPDNFFNFADVGACAFCARTATIRWGAVIGYIGSSPPAAGSYTSAAIRPEAAKVFFVGGSYKASAPATGRLWLNKNADAYSNNTADNHGQVSATVHLSQAETRAQYEARARVTAASVKTLEPMRQATDACVRGVMDHMQNLTMKAWLKSQVAPSSHKAADLIFAVGTIYGDGVRVVYRWKNGEYENAAFDVGRIAFTAIGQVPGFTLFSIVGRPAIDCTEAAFWYAGQLGSQLGQLLRKKVQPPATADARIDGAWRLIRLAPTKCIHFPRGCARTPIPLRFQGCAGTVCSLSRTDGDWQRAHRIARHGATWSASFKDIAINCDDGKHAAQIELKLSVTSAKGSEAKSVGGTYKVHAPADPTSCPKEDARAEWILYGSR